MEMIWKITWDHALRRVVVGMRESFPKEAVLGRSGGDEFCIFLPHATGSGIEEKLMDNASDEKQKGSFLNKQIPDSNRILSSGIVRFESLSDHDKPEFATLLIVHIHLRQQ